MALRFYTIIVYSTVILVLMCSIGNMQAATSHMQTSYNHGIRKLECLCSPYGACLPGF